MINVNKSYSSEKNQQKIKKQARYKIQVQMIFYFCLLFCFEGLVNKILSARFWIPLSRLTYCAYLVHPISLLVLVGSFETVRAYSDVHIVSTLYKLLLFK